MIVTFSRYGQGPAQDAVRYLVSSENPDGSERTPPPDVLRGNPEIIRSLIDSLEYEWRYSSGVLTFAETDAQVPEHVQNRIMDRFERVAFAGLCRDQYNILWIKHRHAGRLELNFLVPRAVMTDRGLRHFNMRPPGPRAERLFATFQDYCNARWGFADPNDPARAQDVKLPDRIAKLMAEAKRQGNALAGPTVLRERLHKTITEYVRREVDAERIDDREGVERYLKGLGYEITRYGENYLTVYVPEHDVKVRLKGGLYQRENFNPRDRTLPTRLYDQPDPVSATRYAAELKEMLVSRSAYHRKRYGLHQPEGPERTPEPGEPLEAHLAHLLGENAKEDRQIRTREARRYDVSRRTATSDLAAIRARLSAARISTTAALERVKRTAGRRSQAVAGWARGARPLAYECQGLKRATEQAGHPLSAAASGLDGSVDERWWKRSFYHLDDLDIER